jgi:hypothetical protein
MRWVKKGVFAASKDKATRKKTPREWDIERPNP